MIIVKIYIITRHVSFSQLYYRSLKKRLIKQNGGLEARGEQQLQILRPETLIAEFKKIGVTHIITIPDSETNYLYELMEKEDWLDGLYVV